ncbi:MAG: hypothetical protein M3071_02490 [Actinomycetota bacterium]|nr:hypothetical protein [Actinomycetota bacterium]
MIPGGNPGGGSVGFPNPPTGSPGEIAAIARSLSSAADDLDRVGGGLRGASSTLAQDWQGYAANAYHASSDGLATVAHGGAASFRDCAKALSGYSSVLDHAQSEIRRLRRLYDAEMAAQASAASALTGLQSKLASATKPAAVTNLTSQISTAQTAAQNAATGATGYAGQASTVLADFKRAETRYADVLNGTTLTPGGRPALGGPWLPFAPAGAAGPGFGAPTTDGGVLPGALAAAYGGVIPVGNPWASPIPGYGVYEDGHTPEAVPDGVITQAAVLVGSFFAAGPLGDLGAGVLRSLGEALGIGGAGSAAVTAAGERAYAEKVLAALENGATRNTSLTAILRGAAGNRADAAIMKEITQAQVRAQAIATAVKMAGSKLPTGVSDIITEIANRGWAYSSWSAGKLVSAQSALIKVGTPVALAAAQVIGAILKAVGG